MKETLWTPDSIAVGERVDGLLVLALTDPLELTTIPMGRVDAHRIGAELVKAADLTPEEIARAETPDDDPEILQ